MPAWHRCNPGENPMEMIKKYYENAKRIRKILLIAGAVLLVLSCCGGSVFLLSKTQKAQAQPMGTATVLASPTPSTTATLSSPTPELTPSSTQGTSTAAAPLGSATPSVTPTPSLLPTRAATQTPWVIEHTRVVPVYQDRPVYRTVVVPVVQTQIITSSPGATQTPWVVTQEVTTTPGSPGATQTPWVVTQEVTTTPGSPDATQTPWVITQEVTVVVFPTETPSPTPTETIDPLPPAP